MTEAVNTGRGEGLGLVTQSMVGLLSISYNYF